ncbi:MAG: helix-turn-helix domain-containing protein [Chloroflexota bacterium]|nr:helix-turn-helix domain-containing protein [Chloroflexota bacterium]MDP9473848.1 helix-turn-helix domain-containing protein [Chloroflexota bacterium]
MEEERWYEVKDIVDMLKVHEQTVRRWIKQGDLPAVLFGRRGGYRIKASDLDAFLSTQATKGKAAA